LGSEEVLKKAKKEKEYLTNNEKNKVKCNVHALSRN
jgi:hypothetical protein